MTTILHTSHPGLAGTVEERFIELVCSDEELLRAEFEAIIAAEWPAPPPARPPVRGHAGRPSTPRLNQSAGADPGRPDRQRHSRSFRRLATQRAPPE